MATPLTPWKSTTLMLASTRANTIQRTGWPPTIFAPTRPDWGAPDHHQGLDWAIQREAKGPSTQPLAQE